MCPLCIGTAWLIAGGMGSAGGMATVVWRSVSKRRTGNDGIHSVAPAAEMPPLAMPMPWHARLHGDHEACAQHEAAAAPEAKHGAR
ncbi:hypothetical protein RKE25_09180 [Dyella sp. BiH032]|uniref:hypothetical protein n=1 Tax=Dyella sp. BiH032 TaxID=3075430 RepID=UPI002892B744|nr:hypothetical protein [Dyella sp. BiH032]WNL47787.1 hypothetical protein RKE25_09180 [Dyella sp. BiH032]